MRITLRMTLIILLHALNHLRLTFKTQTSFLVRVDTFENLISFFLILFDFIGILRFETTLLNCLWIFSQSPFDRTLSKIDMTHFSHLRNDAMKLHCSRINSLTCLLSLIRINLVGLLVSYRSGLKLEQICWSTTCWPFLSRSQNSELVNINSSSFCRQNRIEMRQRLSLELLFWRQSQLLLSFLRISFNKFDIIFFFCVPENILHIFKL